MISSITIRTKLPVNEEVVNSYYCVLSSIRKGSGTSPSSHITSSRLYKQLTEKTWSVDGLRNIINDVY